MIIHQQDNSNPNYSHNAFFYTEKIWDYHFHKNLELIYVLQGQVNCTVNNVSHTLSSGDFGICLPYDIHRYEPQQNTLYWVLVFSEDYIHFLSKKFSKKMSIGFPFRASPEVEEYLIKRLIYNENPTALTLKSCLYAICEEFLDKITLADKKGDEILMIATLADYIHENHTRKLSLREISQKLGYDYNYMSRFFRKTFNMTFTDLVNTYRLETAIQLLEYTDKNITTIAYESGFGSARAFNSFFRKNTNISPSQYRKASQK
ncbi:MAG: helix-turn-helix domain-containing protein [Ruminococcaceae bacterium]|nr:helix-turn-helix domain-containing protein [Oscillospiraceae bacterium]